MLFLWFSMLTFALTKRVNENMERDEIIIHKLNRIEKHIFGLKEILNVEELSDYTGFKKSYIYKLVHSNSIAFSKPNGKVLFFERKKIDAWLLKNSHKSNDEIQQEAIEFSLRKK
ncbi:DNA binding domain-containing protein, excisionase family [Kaistella treverensis]|uniref:DNA binding domain-containing protein, excisionase family n=2 Tax=Kaistella treverensis TaxID=631455 RepID=A0A1I3JLD0_9FLAO|nr:DNA binding domain-containing protein, excisionase family [Kaistella treverensis]